MNMLLLHSTTSICGFVSCLLGECEQTLNGKVAELPSYACIIPDALVLYYTLSTPCFSRPEALVLVTLNPRP